MKEEQGGFAFMMEDAGIQYLIERNCELAQVSLKLTLCFYFHSKVHSSQTEEQ